MSINMNLIPHRRLTNLFMLGCSAFALSLYSCNKSGENTALTGETVVKINLSGVEAYNETDNSAVQKQASANASHSSSNAPDVQEMTVPLENGGSVDVVLTNNSAVTKSLVASSNPKLAAVQTQEKPLDKNVKYKVVVYDNQGAYVTAKDYSYGEEATAAGIVLDAGKSYTFIAYSINSTTALPAINNQNTLSAANLSNISGDLMYYTGTLTLKSGVNNLNVVLKHRFSQITTTLTMDPSMTGAITQIGTAVLKPSHSSANLKFSDETLTYNGLNNAGVTTQFPALGNGLRTVISNPSLLIHPTTSNGTLMLGSLTLDDETKTNITIPNVKINPGQKYDLKLNFRTCTQNVTSSGLDWSYPATTSGGKTGIMKDGKFYANGTTIDRSFTAPAADYGFVFDMTELDNAFNMEVNGVKLAKQEIQFEVGASSAQNIQFVDGSKYAGNNIETNKRIDQVYNMKGTSTSPLIKLVISRTGQVTMFGSKTSGGPLYELKLVNGNSFNTFPWSATQSNTVKVTQLVDGRTIIKGVGAGKKKIPCQ
ncbi:fimbrillin family protein [Sphingobacterium paramultivorum]|uniref:Fimbrillin family protein n=1 Tax=Sphingobacterium paramultivorum TaxID=2886510 RepID=A0A7G5E0Y8_9SPHI|nr:fimbrillin family protein [Sphingobacterium paramultivorum]QMV67663.1 fimbrillin family protein [Sphingobacterium paramultivorum]WSO16544.1 fimbrillin family protein [Sphingobacterium paramultivorum]